MRRRPQWRVVVAEGVDNSSAIRDPGALREPEVPALAFHLHTQTYSYIRRIGSITAEFSEYNGEFSECNGHHMHAELPPWTSSTFAAHRISAAATTAQHRADEEDDAAGINIFDINFSFCLSRLHVGSFLYVYI